MTCWWRSGDFENPNFMKKHIWQCFQQNVERMRCIAIFEQNLNMQQVCVCVCVEQMGDDDQFYIWDQSTRANPQKLSETSSSS